MGVYRRRFACSGPRRAMNSTAIPLFSTAAIPVPHFYAVIAVAGTCSTVLPTYHPYAAYRRRAILPVTIPPFVSPFCFRFFSVLHSAHLLNGTACRRLATLSANANAIADVPGEIGGLDSLMTLDLSANVLIELPGELAALPSLLTLTLAGNRLEDLPEGSYPALKT